MKNILRATTLTLILGALALPGAALAKDGKDNGKGPHRKVKVEQRHGDDGRREVRRDRDRDGRRHDEPRYVQGCPPGLAKKSPACVPPGQAKKAYRRDHDGDIVIHVGDVFDWDRGHRVRYPGRYGLDPAPYGSRYAIIDGRLVRVDDDTNKVLNIIRLVDAILD